MKPIAVITKPVARTLEDELAEFIRPWAAARGLTFTPRGGRFDSTVLSLKIDLAVAPSDPNAVPNSPEATAFRQLAVHYGLAATDLGATVTIDGRSCQIIGLKPRSDKRPILLRSRSGSGPERLTVVSAEYAVMLLERERRTQPVAAA